MDSSIWKDAISFDFFDAGSGEDSCPRCEGKVFPLEKIGIVGKQFHKNCFNCAGCKTILTLANFFDGADAEIYCRNCYLQRFFFGGKNFFLDYSNVVADEHDPSACIRENIITMKQNDSQGFF